MSAAKTPASRPIPYGPTASGGQASQPYCPTVLLQAEELDSARSSGHDLTAALPLPLGMKLAENPHTGQVQLIFESPVFCERSRRLFGYVGEISTKASRGTASSFPPWLLLPLPHTPPFWGSFALSPFLWGKPSLTGALLQIVVQIPFRYGLTTAECASSWVFCRVQAFSSHAAPSHGTGFLRVGEPVVGFVEPTNRHAHSAQLTSWDKTTPEFWRASAPASVPFKIELSSHAIYRLPQLSAHGFAYLRPPKLHVLRFDTPVDAAPAPKGASSPARSKSRGRSRGPRNPKTPSWHGEHTEKEKFESNPATASEIPSVFSPLTLSRKGLVSPSLSRNRSTAALGTAKKRKPQLAN